MVVVPKGVFLSGALFFKNGVSLHVETNGVLKGSVNPDDYPQIPTRWEGVEREWTSAFLNFDNMTNVVVSGDGTIDGSGDLWMQRGGGPRRAPGQSPGATNAPAAVAPAPSAPIPGLRRGRPRMICFTHCRNVRIADLHLQRQAVWCLHLLYCQDVVADHLNIRAIERIPSSDGIDVDSCRDVQITHCDIACNDDNIAIKCGKDADGLRVNQPSENITISDCLIGAGAGITMGSEVSGSIRHVLVENCRFAGSDAAARFKSQPSRGGVIEDIPPGFADKLGGFLAEMHERIDQYGAMLSKNEIVLQRLRGTCAVDADTLLSLGVTGPLLRAAGYGWDLRKASPYSSYDDFEFKIPVGTTGDNYDRYACRLAEMYESVKIIQQALDGLPEGPHITEDRKVALPPRHELATSMEALIHHFKLVTEGFRVPPGEVYFPIESPRGELGCYVRSDGSSKPARVHMREPSFVNLQATAPMVEGSYIADLIATLAMMDPVLGGIDR